MLLLFSDVILLSDDACIEVLEKEKDDDEPNVRGKVARRKAWFKVILDKMTKRRVDDDGANKLIINIPYNFFWEIVTSVKT